MKRNISHRFLHIKTQQLKKGWNASDGKILQQKLKSDGTGINWSMKSVLIGGETARSNIFSVMESVHENQHDWIYQDKR